ncbi:unnamed protein product [Coffea canephora]|uniref:Exocyst subunit Exo70 family protein n=1 Tax=Coffea canephora TaxID=49390 RepID=A0A068UL59_COFCA|nr:unnamed protein product [Coffea canephora]
MRNKIFLSPLTSPTSSHSSSHSSKTSPHTLSATIMEENVDCAEVIIRKWDLNATDSARLYSSNTPSLFAQDHRSQAQQFIKSVNDLQSAMHFFVSEDPGSPMLIRAQNLMQIAMKRLEKEFYSVLKTNMTALHPESVSLRSSSSRASSTWSAFSDFQNRETSEGEDDDDEITTDIDQIHIKSNKTEKVYEDVMSDLRVIANCMISSGYGKECTHIYNLIRKSIIDETLYYLGVEQLSSSQLQKMAWDDIEVKIKKWLAAVKTAVKTLFHGERVLCDHVFCASEKIRETCFTEISRGNALTLFSFPENVARCKKIFSPEKMFRFLDIYEAVSELWIDIGMIFSFDSLSGVRAQAMTSLLKLGEAVRTMLLQFESAIEKDSSKTAVPGGGVHPLARYVMNYLVFLTDYSGALADIVADWPTSVQTSLPESYLSSPISANDVDDDSPASTISVRLAWIILVLLCKLDGKAGCYGDHVALSYLFLANNLNYVVSKVKTSNLMPLMGPDWVSKHESKGKQYSAKYERMGWAKVLTSLPDDPTVEISLPEIKDSFRKFNSGFEEAYRVQSSWVIPDSKLRDQIKFSLSEKMVPGYRVFYENHREEVGDESIVRFTPDDLENCLSDLFQGRSEGMGSSRATSYRVSSVSTSPSSSWTGH